MWSVAQMARTPGCPRRGNLAREAGGPSPSVPPEISYKGDYAGLISR